MDEIMLRGWIDGVLHGDEAALHLPYGSFAERCALLLSTEFHPTFMTCDVDARRAVLRHVEQRIAALLAYTDQPRLHTWIDLLARLGYGLTQSISTELYFRYALALFDDPALLYEYDDQFVDTLLYRIVGDLWTGLRRTTVPLALRVAVIDACFILFAGWYSRLDAPSEPCGMFFDILVGRLLNRVPQDDDERAIRDALFECLAKVLRIGNPYCQLAALHGFNHLEDDRCWPLIDAFLEDCTDRRLRRYARVCREYKTL